MKGRLIDTRTKEYIQLKKCVHCGSRKEYKFDAEMITKTYEHDDRTQYKISEILEVCPKCRAVDFRKINH